MKEKFIEQLESFKSKEEPYFYSYQMGVNGETVYLMDAIDKLFEKYRALGIPMMKIYSSDDMYNDYGDYNVVYYNKENNTLETFEIPVINTEEDE